MNSIKVKSGIWGMILAFSLLFGIGVISGTSAQAQDTWGRNQQGQNRDWERNRDNRDNRDRRYRRDRSRDRADRDGNWDGNRNRDYRYRRDNRNGQYGRGGYGNGQYGRGGYGNNGYNAYQVAQNEGYQDGLNTGANDAQRGQSYNPQRSHFYRNGHGDNSSYGNNGQYKQAYRQGFLQGYQQGFQQYGGYNNRNGNYRRRFPFPW